MSQEINDSKLQISTQIHLLIIEGIC